MSTGLPEIIDPIALCKRGAELVGNIPLDSMQRLKSIVIDVLGDARVELQFSSTRYTGKRITGQVAGAVFAECQRCLEPVQLNINCEVNLQLVKDEAAAAELAEDCDPLLAQEDSEFRLLEIVEDELLLALPIVALHEQPACEVAVSSKDRKNEQTDPSNRSNPFSSLSLLKQPKE